MEKYYMRFLAAIVGQACNLRCLNCSNLTPFAPHETKRYNVDHIIESLETLIYGGGGVRIRLLQIQGGEPFLHPALEKLLEFVKDEEDIEKCLIATNGTVVPNVSPQILTDEKFIVRVSNYPAIAIENKAETWLKKHDIRHEVYHFISGEDKWYDCGKKMNVPGDVEKRFCNCLFKDCYTLEEGKIGRCARSVISWKIQGYDLEDSIQKGDYILVSERPGLREELENYIQHPHFMEACRHCNGTDNRTQVEPAVQMNSGDKWEDFL